MHWSASQSFSCLVGYGEVLQKPNKSPRCGKSDFQDGGKGEIELQAVGKILQCKGAMWRCSV